MKKLSDAEWKVMTVIWRRGPVSLMEIADEIMEATQWTRNTVMTFITRLYDKGAIAYEERGRTRYYYAVVDSDTVRKEETGDFIDRVFGGNVGLLLNNLVSANRLTKSDIDELYAYIEEEK